MGVRIETAAYEATTISMPLLWPGRNSESTESLLLCLWAVVRVLGRVTKRDRCEVPKHMGQKRPRSQLTLPVAKEGCRTHNEGHTHLAKGEVRRELRWYEVARKLDSILFPRWL